MGREPHPLPLRYEFEDLQATVERLPGVTFGHDGTAMSDPWLSCCLRFPATPEESGFVLAPEGKAQARWRRNEDAKGDAVSASDENPGEPWHTRILTGDRDAWRMEMIDPHGWPMWEMDVVRGESVSVRARVATPPEGFELEHTGGGCTAFVRYDGDPRKAEDYTYVMITDYDLEAEAPSVLTERWALGVYTGGRRGDDMVGFAKCAPFEGVPPTSILRALMDDGERCRSALATLTRAVEEGSVTDINAAALAGRRALGWEAGS